MQVNLLRAKFLRAEVTDAHVDYEGSLAIDSELMRMIDLLPYEKILVGNLANGNRFETYAIEAPAGSKTFSLRGAAARLGKPGDLLVIMSFANMSVEEARTWQPRVIVLGDGNRKILKQTNTLPL